MTPTALPVYFVRGDDPVLTVDAVRQLIADLVADDDPAFAVHDLSSDDYEMPAFVRAAQTLPLFGEAGGVAPWDLTDAIDRGDTAVALENVHRLVTNGRHPLVILASLHNHYTRILRLEGSNAADEKAAAQMLGITGSTFPARKALSQTRRLGHDAVARAVTLLADADLALKGAIEWPDGLVLEVLVARLSRLGPRGAP